MERNPRGEADRHQHGPEWQILLRRQREGDEGVDDKLSTASMCQLPSAQTAPCPPETEPRRATGTQMVADPDLAGERLRDAGQEKRRPPQVGYAPQQQRGGQRCQSTLKA